MGPQAVRSFLLRSTRIARSVADAAAGIAYAHRMAKQYLDWAPIDAALDYAIESL